MRFEALLWSLLAITAPGAALWLWRRINPAIPPWAQPVFNGAGWLHGLILPYSALVLGSIPGGLVGLYAITPLEWITGSLACLSGLAAVLLVHQLRPGSELQPGDALERWKDEPRWALYRATGALLLQDVALGAGLGFVFSILEWAFTSLTRQPQDTSLQDREPLYRSGVSTILFLLTRNFWLTAGTQLVFFILLDLWAGRQMSEPPHLESPAN